VNVLFIRLLFKQTSTTNSADTVGNIIILTYNTYNKICNSVVVIIVPIETAPQQRNILSSSLIL